MINIIQPRRQLFNHIFCATTLSYGGVSQGLYKGLNIGAHVGDKISRVTYNRSLLDNFIRRKFSNESSPVYLKQAHTDVVLSLDQVHQRDSLVDAVYTNKPMTPIGIMTADCLPIILTDGDIICAVHAGWRGLKSDIIKNAVDVFKQPSLVKAWIGPHICQQHFEVGNDVASVFQHITNAVKTSGLRGKYLLDMFTVVKFQLSKYGVQTVNKSTDCTYTHPELYSHRKVTKSGHKSTGRNYTFIIKVEN